MFKKMTKNILPKCIIELILSWIASGCIIYMDHNMHIINENRYIPLKSDPPYMFCKKRLVINDIINNKTINLARRSFIKII